MLAVNTLKMCVGVSFEISSSLAKGKTVLVMAITNQAATLLEGGSTVHYQLKAEFHQMASILFQNSNQQLTEVFLFKLRQEFLIKVENTKISSWTSCNLIFQNQNGGSHQHTFSYF